MANGTDPRTPEHQHRNTRINQVNRKRLISDTPTRSIDRPGFIDGLFQSNQTLMNRARKANEQQQFRNVQKRKLENVHKNLKKYNRNTDRF